MSSPPEEPVPFVHKALTQGIGRDMIEAVLLEAGWTREKVSGALREFAEVGSDFPIPVPRPKPYLSAREAFLYLLLFTALFLVSFNFGSILFELIEKRFPDPAAPSYFDYSEETLRWNVAYMVVSFPLFLFLTFHLGKELRKDPGKRASKIRKWLTYLTLFVAAGSFVGDLVVLIHHFLGGELTVRFSLKILVVAAISGTVFGYYLHDLSQEER